MKFSALFIFGLLSVGNAAISKVESESFFQRNFPKKFSMISKIHTKTNHAGFSTSNNDKILHNRMMLKNDGTYHYQFQTSNGITAQEHGLAGVAVKGTSSYISPEGNKIEMSYTADENGFRPIGEHIPKTPDYILKALEFIRTHPFKEIYMPTNYMHRRNSNKVSQLITNAASPLTEKPPSRKAIPTSR